MRKIYIVILAIIVLSFVVGFYFYPRMPLQMVSHWNAKGEADGFILKFWGLFLMPAISLGLFLLFALFPKIDPMKENIAKFRKYFDGFVLAIIIYLFYIYILTILWNLGIYFDMAKFIIPSIAALFYFAGVLVGKAQRNFFIGIRTPWTLSSDNVWNKTHKLGSKLFKVSGIIGLLGIFFGDYAFYFVLFPVFFSAFYLIFYSYFEYQKERRKNNQTQ
jgi:uncharacterized membrane protein